MYAQLMWGYLSGDVKENKVVYWHPLVMEQESVASEESMVCVVTLYWLERALGLGCCLGVGSHLAGHQGRVVAANGHWPQGDLQMGTVTWWHAVKGDDGIAGRKPVPGHSPGKLAAAFAVESPELASDPRAATAAVLACVKGSCTAMSAHPHLLDADC